MQEITQPLQELGDDPLADLNVEFPTVLRGYDRQLVDEYVAHARGLVAELQATRSPEAAVRRALERVGEQISGILQRAHDTAEEITSTSRREAEGRLEHARAEAHDISAAAEQRVRNLDADTDRIWLERQRIVSDAEDLAARLLELARIAGDRFPADPPAADDDGTAERDAVIAVNAADDDEGDLDAEVDGAASGGDRAAEDQTLLLGPEDPTLRTATEDDEPAA